MTVLPLVVALEGPCCAGKTTLAVALLQDMTDLAVAFVPCYADFAGGGQYLPRQEADSIAERQDALRQLLTIEAARMAAVPPETDVILADRSVHTLLANSYALQRRTGVAFLTPSRRLLRESPAPAWPCLVVYLDLPQHAVPGRNNGKFPAGSIYIDPGFNTAISQYFGRLAGRECPRVAWLDATLDPAELTRITSALLRAEVARHHI